MTKIDEYLIIKFQIGLRRHKTKNTYAKRDSAPLSAKAHKALSKGCCTFAQARSNSIRLCAHFEAINSRPDLKKKNVNGMKH